jgi:hypothetical protein
VHARVVKNETLRQIDYSNFSIVNFPFICSNLPAAHEYGVYISQLIRYSRACGSYEDFLDRGLLLTRKLLNHGFLFVDELRFSGRVGSSCSTSDTRRVNLVTNPVISREWGKDREVFTTSGTYPWSFVTQIFRYSRACGSYEDFLDRGLLLTRKLLNHGFLFVKLKSSLRKFYGRHHELVDRYGISVSQMITDMFHL